MEQYKAYCKENHIKNGMIKNDIDVSNKPIKQNKHIVFEETEIEISNSKQENDPLPPSTPLVSTQETIEPEKQFASTKKEKHHKKTHEHKRKHEKKHEHKKKHSKS